MLDIGDMTLDQAFFLLVDRKRIGGKDKQSAAEAAALLTDEDGFIKGRDKDGKPMKAKILGKSKARILMEAAAKKKREEN